MCSFVASGTNLIGFLCIGGKNTNLGCFFVIKRSDFEAKPTIETCFPCPLQSKNLGQHIWLKKTFTRGSILTELPLRARPTWYAVHHKMVDGST